MAKIKTSLIILTRNEITGLKHILKRIPLKKVDEYFAVDYRSTDGTVEYFKKHGIPVIKQVKAGRSEAFRLGVKKSKGDILIFFSPDGNEDPKDIPKLIKYIQNGADLAIASRFLPDSRNEEDDQLFKWRKWANQAFTFLANTAFRKTGPYITDTINGYRAIKKQTFQMLNLDAQGFAIEYQMSIRAMKNDCLIQEITTQEGNRIGGQSGSIAIPTGIQFLQLFWKELAS
jgi:glycosyltransferase involved in cell wall biosynthesis